MSDARDAIFAKLRAALPRDPEGQRAAEAAVARRLARPAPNLVPARGQLAREDRIELFTSQARAVQADVRRLASLDEVPATVAAYLRRHNVPQKLVVAPEPLLDGAPFESQPLLRVRRGTAGPDDPAALTLAAAGIAETGTLLLASTATTPTLLAFLPETSIILVPADDIDGAYEDSWARLRAAMGRPPRSVNLVTGPSRTGDIAQKIELGAHGPRRLLILILDELPGDAAQDAASAPEEPDA